uniref:Internal head protein n=1 Tax=Myoviridae sp. ctZhz2 TaxID=2825129 RepID=A0A8S5U8Q9_9CAUD|nr:MAG TPA: Internal head protein [Myoviridae sp. ctZhz2]
MTRSALKSRTFKRKLTRLTRRKRVVTMHKIYWDATAQPIGASFADVIYHLRADDADDLLMDAVSVDDFELDAAEVYDALDVEYRMLERKMNVMRRIMNRADADLKVREDNGPDDMGVNITKPFKRNGTQNIAVIFQLTDGQTVTIVLHNPDLDPGNIKPDDHLLSWKWMINKKDVTIVVAPEKGKDLNVNEVARRIMRLASKNSAAFARANARRAERIANIEKQKGEISDAEKELAQIESDISAAQVENEELVEQLSNKQTELKQAQDAAAERAKKAEEERQKAEEEARRKAEEEQTPAISKGDEKLMFPPITTWMPEGFVQVMASAQRIYQRDPAYRPEDSGINVVQRTLNSRKEKVFDISFTTDVEDKQGGNEEGPNLIAKTKRVRLADLVVDGSNHVVGMRLEYAKKFKLPYKVVQSGGPKTENGEEVPPLSTLDGLVTYIEHDLYREEPDGEKRVAEAMKRLGYTAFSGLDENKVTKNFVLNERGKWDFWMESVPFGAWDTPLAAELLATAYRNGSLKKEAWATHPLNTIEDVVKFIDEEKGWMNYNAPEGGRLRDALYRLDYKAFKGVDGKGNTVEYRDDPQKGWRRKVNGEDSPTDGSPWIDAMYALSKAFKNGSLEKESATNAPDEKARNPAESWETRPLDTLADVVKFIDDESGWWNPAKPAAQRLLEAVKRLGYTSFKGVDGEGSNVEFRQQDDGLWNRTLNGLDTGAEKGYWTSAMYTLSKAFKNGSLAAIDAPDKPAAPGTTVNEMEAEAKAVQQEEQQNADPQWEADKAYCERVINGELSQMGEVSAVIDQIMDIWDRADASGIAERSQLAEQAYNLIEKAALEAGMAAAK